VRAADVTASSDQAPPDGVAPPHDPLLPDEPPAELFWIDRLTIGVARVLSYLFGIVVLLSCWDIFLDITFDSPTIWVYEAVTTMIAVAFLMGGAYALQENAHIRVTPVYDRMPPRMRRVVDILWLIGLQVYMGTFAWFCWRWAFQSVLTGETSGTPWNTYTPVVVKCAMFAGAALLMLQGLANLWRELRALRQEPT
jgi:TRAP-type mannitol/chloroaromatic compound transport system permease small subunit